jgi:hypothetical protein
MQIAVFSVLLTFALPAPTEAEDRIQQLGENLFFAEVLGEPWVPQGFDSGLLVRAKFVADAPNIDGRAADAVWAVAPSTTVPLTYGNVKEATLKAAYSESEIFLLVSWPDATRDDQHHPWVWDAGEKRYVEGTQVEDSLIVSIEGGCDWTPSMLAGYVYDFDAWRWLAARSNPIGQAVDVDGSVQNHWVAKLDFVKYQPRYTEPFWNLKFTDRRDDILTTPWQELKRHYKLAPLSEEVYVRAEPDGTPPPEFAQRLQAPTVTADAKGWLVGEAHASIPPTAPQYRPLKLTADAGEVSAKGEWKDGRWTVEFRRALLTPARTGSDSVFERATQFSIHVFDHTERIDESSESGRLFLQFEPAEETAANE